MSDYGSILTILGQNKLAAFATGGPAITFTHIAVGDANNSVYTPNEAMTALVNERYRAPVTALGTLAGGIIVVEASIPANTNDATGRPSHGFNMWEAGLIDSAGHLCAVTRLPGGPKPSPASGAADDIIIQMKVDIGNVTAVTLSFDPAHFIHIARQLRPYFMSVDDALNAPPVSPTTGATYAVLDAPTGAWAGRANQLAQWVGFWVFRPVQEGHLVVVDARALDHAERWLRKTDTVWTSAAASPTVFGVTRQATEAEVLNRADVAAFVTPGGLDAVAQLQPIFPECEAVDALLTFSHASGSLVVGAAGQTWLHRGLRRFGIDSILLADRTFATVANKTYHVRWHAPGTGTATPAATYPHGRFELADLTGASPAETHPSYDTTFDRMLVARVVTNGSNVATITALANQSRFDVLFNSTGSSTSYGSRTSVPRITGTLNWSRQAKHRLEMADADVGLDNEAIATFGVWPLTTQQSRYAVDYAVIGYLSSGNYMKPHAILRCEA